MKLTLLATLACITVIIHSQTIDDSRTVNWQNAGLSNTCYTAQSIIDFSDAGGTGDGVTNNNTVMSAVLATITSEFTVVYFPPGNYVFNAPIEMKSNMVLKGAGADATTLTFNLSVPDDAIKIKGGETGTISYCTSDIAKGANAIGVENASGFAAGDYIKLFEQDDMLVTSSWGLYTTGQIFKIESISGNTVYVDAEVRRDFFVSRSARIMKLNPKVNTGIEDVSVIRQDETVKNTSNIYFKYAAECWVRGVASYECNYAHIELHTTTHTEVSGCYIQDAFSYGDGGRAYGVVAHYASGDNLITNNIFNHLRHSMLLQAGANGNVFSYNYSINPYWTGTWLPSSSAGDLVLHGNYPYANLLEGNTVQNIVIDDSHGANGKYNTFFRNRAELYGITMSSSAAGGYQNFVGNEITNSGFLLGLYSLSGSGHFEYGNNKNGTIIPSGTSDLPESTLYMETAEPFYLSESAFPPIGTPQPLDNFLIEAEMRYNDDQLTISSACNSRIILVDDLDNSVYCNGDSVHINFSTAGEFNIGNNFTIQLVNTLYPAVVISITTVGDDNALTGSVADIPQGNYNVRVCSSSPYVEGTFADEIISIGNNYSTSFTTTIDEGGVYILPDGSATSTAGVYVFNYLNVYGCDSIITVTVNVNATCGAPDGIGVSTITASKAKIIWTAETGASTYQVFYRPFGAASWLKKTSTTTSKLLTGLSPSTTYEYKVRSKCGAVWSAYSATNNFTTLALRQGEFEVDNNIEIFPNPTDGNVILDANGNAIYAIVIYNMQGQKIYAQEFISGSVQPISVDLHAYTKGLYLVQVQTNQRIANMQLMLQ